MTLEAASKLKHAGVCSCPCSHKQKAYILETVLLCLFEKAQVVLHLAAISIVLLEASPRPQHSLWTVESKWKGNWDAQCRSEEHVISMDFRRQWKILSVGVWPISVEESNWGSQWGHSGENFKASRDQGVVCHFYKTSIDQGFFLPFPCLAYCYIASLTPDKKYWYFHLIEEKTEAHRHTCHNDVTNTGLLIIKLCLFSLHS